jgi:putative transposase
MTEKITSVSSMPKQAKTTVSRSETERAAVRELVKAARARGEDLTGPDGLLKAITATVLETALEEELTDHLGHEKHQAPAAGNGNIRNGTRPKTVLTDAAGEVRIAVPRDRAGTFEPVIVKKRQRRLSDVDAVAISLFAKGLTTGEISAHFAEVYGASIGKDTVSRITDKVLEEMATWSSRPLQPVYAAIFIDAIYVKVRDGQVGNQPFYAAIGVDLGGRRDVLGLWAGQGSGESAKFWMNVLTDRKNRGVRDVFFIVCDGLKGLPDSVNAVFPQAIVQACVIHLIRATLRYASRKYWDQLATDLRRIYTAPSVAAAWAAFEELEEKWGTPYPAIPKMWRASWEEFIGVPGLRGGDPPGAVLHQRDRVPARPLPAGRHRARTLPDRAGRTEMPLPGNSRAGPHRHRAGTMDHAVEARTQRFRRHLRRPHAGRGDPLR